MIERRLILNYLAEYLKTNDFSDYCVNGLQVEGRAVIDKIATAVSISDRCIAECVRIGAGLLIVHHGIFWKNSPHPFALMGTTRNRIARLLENNINLAAYHLPLDAHQDVGNNIEILKKLNIKPAGRVNVGWYGNLKSISTKAFKRKLDSILPNPSTFFPGESKTIRSVAVISGGASYQLEEVHRSGIDAFITGDAIEPAVRICEETGMHFFVCGHYNTERFGPLALAEHLKRQFKLPVHFIDVPNPV